MNEEEIINEIKKDREYYDIVEDLKQRNYSLKDVLKLFADTETGNYTEYDIACCIVYLLDLYKAEKEKNKELYTQECINMEYELGYGQGSYYAEKEWKDKIRAKIEEYDKQIKQLEKDDVGIGFTLGKEWSDLKAKKSVLQELLEEE